MTPLLMEIPMHTHPIWENTFFYLFIGIFVSSALLIRFLVKKNTKKINENDDMQKQHIARIDKLREDQLQLIDSLYGEMLKKEEERTRQWIESEKETLHVLNGVSSLLELSENISRVESEKIINKLEEIKLIIREKSSKNE